jgi:hypothetical protein
MATAVENFLNIILCSFLDFDFDGFLFTSIIIHPYSYGIIFGGKHRLDSIPVFSREVHIIVSVPLMNI